MFEGADDHGVSIGGFATMNSSIAAAIQSAGAKMSSAADSIATGNLDGYVDASTQMSEAKLTMGIAAKLAQTERAMFKSTLDMLV